MIMAQALEANAACIPHDVAESAVANRTYALESSLYTKNTVYLTFGDTKDLEAGYGSIVDGHPGGVYNFQGNCHGEVIVTFTSYFGSNPEPKEVLHLRPTGPDYFQLKSVDDQSKTFKFVHE